MLNEEKVLGVITNTALHAGFLGARTRTHCLVITDRRILFARQTTASMKALSERANPGGSLLAQMGSAGQAYALLIEGYLAMSPEAILAEHADNFAIERTAVTKVKIKTSSGGESGVSTDTLLIKTSDKTYKLTLMSAGQARRILQDTGLLPA